MVQFRQIEPVPSCVQDAEMPGSPTGDVRLYHSSKRASCKPALAGLAIGVLVGTALTATLQRPSSVQQQQSAGITRMYTEVIPKKKENDEKEDVHLKPEPFMPLLLCFSMVRTDGYEKELMSAQYYNNAGIFACDEYQVYSNGGKTFVGDIETTDVIAEESTMGDTSDATDSWLNTMTFIKAWDMIIEDGRWWSHDWTVKMDPDAVFFPHRLRSQIKIHTGGLNAQPSWVGNCDRTWHDSKPHLKLFGSIEIFSRNAIGTYKAFKNKCFKNLPWQKWGEDLYMQSCMDMLKVHAINGTGYLGDERCYYAPCTDTNKVAFHAFKDVDSFFQCWGQSKGSEKVLEDMKEEAIREEEQRKVRELEKQLEQERAEEKRREQEKKKQDKLNKEQEEATKVQLEKAESSSNVTKNVISKKLMEEQEHLSRKEMNSFDDEVLIRK